MLSGAGGGRRCGRSCRGPGRGRMPGVSAETSDAIACSVHRRVGWPRLPVGETGTRSHMRRSRPNVKLPAVSATRLTRCSGSLISPGLEFLPHPLAPPGGVLLRKTMIARATATAAASRTLPARTRYNDTGEGHHRYRVALGRGGERPYPAARGAVPCLAAQQRCLAAWSLAPAIASADVARAGERQAPEGAVSTMRTAQTNLGTTCAVSAVERRSRQKHVEDHHEQDTEQDRNQHDRCQKSLHVPNVTPRSRPGRALRVSVRERPFVTEVNGPLMARRPFV